MNLSAGLGQTYNDAPLLWQWTSLDIYQQGDVAHEADVVNSESAMIGVGKNIITTYY